MLRTLCRLLHSAIPTLWQPDMTIWLISDTHFGEQPGRRLKACGLVGDTLDE